MILIRINYTTIGKKMIKSLPLVILREGKNFQVMVRIGQQERKLKSLLKQL